MFKNCLRRAGACLRMDPRCKLVRPIRYTLPLQIYGTLQKCNRQISLHLQQLKVRLVRSIFRDVRC